jgi:N-acylglucosamine-6-phosphate 2-epimerase
MVTLAVSEILAALRGGLIVSCQAEQGTPLGTPAVLSALAAAAVRGGAVGIRANGPENIAAISRVVSVPLIGIHKVVTAGSDVYITPTFADAQAVHAAANPPPAIIAFDATDRLRADRGDWRTLLRRIRTELGALAMADIATVAEGRAAAEAGADIVATTLSGYTAETAAQHEGGPDLELVRALASCGVPVICEGRIRTPELARQALEAGAHAVVVGTAITAIDWVTRTYIAQMRTHPH